jgi:STE24 endopeptidase
MSFWTGVFLSAVAANLGLRLWLARRQIRHVRARRERVPPGFDGVLTPAQHRFASDYTVARTRLAAVDASVEAAALLAWTLGGGLAAVDAAWRGLELGPMGTGVGVLVSVVIIAGCIDLPLRAWRTFAIETRFGFNRTTTALFAMDQAKATLLLLALGTPVAAAVLWLMHASGPYWWIYAWALWLAFNIALIAAYPRLIAPLFNRLEPLADRGLRARVEAVVERCGFASNGVFVADGSRRSSHANAYFGGLERGKRVIFFDTLLQQLSGAEVEAVLAHELGHCRRGHIAKNIAVMAATSLLALAALAWLAQQPLFYSALGVAEPSMHAALALFILLLPLATIVVQPALARLSRRHEREADAFARDQGLAPPLASALVTLYRGNATVVAPDPVWSRFYDSHPPPAERVGDLQSAGASIAV